MNSQDAGEESFAIWCPLIPFSKLKNMTQYVVELERVNERYDDWRASMRSKKIVGVHVGVLLDRIRILLMGIGIACASNRSLADTVQSIIVDCLRKSCLEALDRLGGGKPPNVTKSIRKFFELLRFTRDIYPEEEAEKASMAAGINASQSEQEMILDVSATILKAIYIRLLSPDPWQFIDDSD
ncbi:MAG: hypothetical protein ACFFEF_01920 [Candidatus Thorarchaeota archaeon]